MNFLNSKFNRDMTYNRDHRVVHNFVSDSCSLQKLLQLVIHIIETCLWLSYVFCGAILETHLAHTRKYPLRGYFLAPPGRRKRITLKFDRDVTWRDVTDIRTSGNPDRETCQLKYYFRYSQYSAEKIEKKPTLQILVTHQPGI